MIDKYSELKQKLKNQNFIYTTIYDAFLIFILSWDAPICYYYINNDNVGRWRSTANYQDNNLSSLTIINAIR